MFSLFCLIVQKVLILSLQKIKNFKIHNQNIKNELKNTLFNQILMLP